VTQTISTRHFHPTAQPNGWTGTTFSFSAIGASMGTYWTSYANTATWNNLRVGVFMENQGGITNTFSMEGKHTRWPCMHLLSLFRVTCARC
jgi:hypothetical protein